MKIALVAISWMGSHNRTVAGAGFTKAAFTARNRAIASMPSLALLTLAGMTPREHEVGYFEIEDLEQWSSLPHDVDLVAFSSYTAGIDMAYALSERYRALGVPTVIGGPHVSLLPDEATRHCDAVAIGEGEVCWPQILEDVQRGALKQFYGSLEAPFDLADAPMPAHHLLDPARCNRLTVETSRGCPHRCEFCASSILLAQKYKQKPIAKVLAEIDHILERWRRPFIEFADDNTFVNRKYWYELLPELEKRRIRWFAEADVRLAREEKLLDMMREAGCRQVLMGLESPSPADLSGIELHNNWKSKQEMFPAEVVRRVQSHGILVNGCFVLGLDSQGPDIFDAIYDFACATNIYDIQITLMTPFPGTPLYDRLKEEGRLIEDRAWSKCTLFDINFVPKNMTVDELAKGFADLAVRLYDESFTKHRRAVLRKEIRMAAQTRGQAPIVLPG